MPSSQEPSKSRKWFNREILGFGITSFFSDLSHEVATTLLPLFMASLGAPAYAIGIIEGVSDGLASISKYIGGWISDRIAKRKLMAAGGYGVTALFMGMFGLATNWTQALFFRSAGWIGRGLRLPVRDALFHDSVTPQTSGRAFGFERMLDTCGAVLAPLLAFFFLPKLGFEKLFMLTWIPGFLAVLTFMMLTRDHREHHERSFFSLREGFSKMPPHFRHYLTAITLFGLSDFSHALIIFWAGHLMTPVYGAAKASGLAILMYAFHNLVYAAAAYPAGRLADKIGKFRVLEFGYILACVMYAGFIFASGNLFVLFGLFALRGFYAAIEDTLERAIAGDLLTSDIKGTGYGILSAANGIGDLISSFVVGFLMSGGSPVFSFGYCLVLAILGTFALMRVSAESHQR